MFPVAQWLEYGTSNARVMGSLVSRRDTAMAIEVVQNLVIK